MSKKEILKTYIELIKKMKSIKNNDIKIQSFNSEEYKKALHDREKVEAEYTKFQTLSRIIK